MLRVTAYLSAHDVGCCLGAASRAWSARVHGSPHVWMHLWERDRHCCGASCGTDDEVLQVPAGLGLDAFSDIARPTAVYKEALRCALNAHLHRSLAGVFDERLKCGRSVLTTQDLESLQQLTDEIEAQERADLPQMWSVLFYKHCRGCGIAGGAARAERVVRQQHRTMVTKREEHERSLGALRHGISRCEGIVRRLRRLNSYTESATASSSVPLEKRAKYSPSYYLYDVEDGTALEARIAALRGHAEPGVGC